MADFLKVTQRRSSIGAAKNQAASLRGLGLTRRGRTAFVIDTPSTRGLVATVAHLIDWSECTKAERAAAETVTRTPEYVLE